MSEPNKQGASVNGKSRLNEALRITRVGIVANIGLIIIKFAGGIFGKSGAVIADAVHSFADFATDIIVIVGLKLSDKPADSTHRYGHGKFETLASLILGFILLGTGVGICWSGIGNVILFFQNKSIYRPTWIAFVAALLSVIVKEWLYVITIRSGKKLNSQSLVANAINHRSDALSSLGVVIGIAGAVFLGEKWSVLDPVAAVVVGIFIFKTSFSIIKASIDELLEASLGPLIENEIMDLCREIPDVIYPHNLKTRRVGKNMVIDIHIEVDPGLNIKEAHDISDRLEDALQNRFGPDTVITVHVDPGKTRE
jgi:cation diffusion facilitator family transporter